MGQGACVERVRFGQLPSGFSKVTGLAGIIHRHGEASRGQRGDHRPLGAPSSFEHNEGGLHGLEPRHEGGNPRLIVGYRPAFASGPQGDIKLSFSDINTNKKLETVAEILDSIWTGQVITFILPVPTIFSQGSQRCLDRVTTCQTPPRALSTSRTSPYPNWDCIAETISTPPVHDVAISPLATPRTSAPCTTWAI